jgi:cell division septation protein DedD
VVAVPEIEPVAVVLVPEAEPAAVVLVVSAAEPPAAVAVVPEAEPVAVVAAPEVERPATVVVASEPVRVAAAPASSPAADKSVPAPASRAATDLPVRVSTRPARPSTATAGSAADQISRRVSAVLASTGAASPPTSPPTPTLPGTSKGGDPVVRVAARPDPAAFIVQIGAYHDPDNALELEHQLIAAGFPALARSYRVAGGGIVHRVAVSRNVTRTKAGQLLAGLRDAGYDGFITRRDDVSYLPPPPPTR